MKSINTVMNKNKILKHYFVGISLGSQNSSETGIAILDKNLKIITLDKIFSMQDINFFFENFISKQNAIFMVSMADDATMLNCKWKVLAKKFQHLDKNPAFQNRSNWMNRFTTRGAELFGKYKNEGIDIFRYDISELKRIFGLSKIYKDRSPADCKYLQSALKVKFLLDGIMSNMIPASQLEAILGAILARQMYLGKNNVDYKRIYKYMGLDVINLTHDPFKAEIVLF